MPIRPRLPAAQNDGDLVCEDENDLVAALVNVPAKWYPSWARRLSKLLEQAEGVQGMPACPVLPISNPPVADAAGAT